MPTAAGIFFLLLTWATDSAGMVSKISAVARALDLPGEALVAEVEAGLDAAASLAAAVTALARVHSLLALWDGAVMAGGEGTEARGIAGLAADVTAATEVEG